MINAEQLVEAACIYLVVLHACGFGRLYSRTITQHFVRCSRKASSAAWTTAGPSRVVRLKNNIILLHEEQLAHFPLFPDIFPRLCQH